MLIGCSNLTWYVLPPTKSIPWSRPVVNREPKLVNSKTADITYAILRFLKKLIFTFLKRPLVIAVEKSNLPPLFTYQSINNLVIKIAVNNDVTIPIIKVVAKPLIGPVPKTNNINAVKPVVMLASKIEDNALANPSFTDSFCDFPLSISSLIRSKIRTLASTDIPIVKTIPAIPGNVNTAPKLASTPKINKMFNNKAISANPPALP